MSDIYNSNVGESLSVICSLCNERYTSRSKLFKHLEDSHGYISSKGKSQRALILFGWLSSVPVEEERDEWIKDSDINPTTPPWTTPSDLLEAELFSAIESVAAASPVRVTERPKGYSRSSTCSQRACHVVGMEPANHGLCDTILYQSKQRLAPADVETWLDKVNALLPQYMRVLDRLIMPGGAFEFNAESNCSQRCYECLLPLSLLMPPELAIRPASPIAKRWQRRQELMKLAAAAGKGSPESNGGEFDDNYSFEKDTANGTVGSDELCISGTDDHGFKQVTGQSLTQVLRQGLSQSAMDRDYPVDTEDARRRVAFFRNMKKLLKKFNGRLYMHNFASGGATPGDSPSHRRVDRFHHAEIVTLGEECWALLGVSGDLFLRGQVARMVGLVLAVMRGWLSEDYVDECLRKDTIARTPAVPGFTVYLSESRFAYYEAGCDPGERLDPRRRPVGGAGNGHSSGSDTGVARIQAWRQCVHTRVAQQWAVQCADGAWEERFQAQCRAIAESHAALFQLRNRSQEELQLRLTNMMQPSPLPLSSESYGFCNAPAEYLLVLQLLREADKSGLWPPSSSQRQKVIISRDMETKKKFGKNKVSSVSGIDSPRDTARKSSQLSGRKVSFNKGLYADNFNTDCYGQSYHKDKSHTTESVGNLVATCISEVIDSSSERGDINARDENLLTDGPYDGSVGTCRTGNVVGGSFSVGRLGPQLPEPKGNRLFPALTEACFALERMLKPDRAPSTAIAINRHAQFLPHRDSGAGNGQSTSLFVSLGDFFGGELVLDTTPVDARYRPVEFDGWSTRHWTLPFVGERYSLVWFTPVSGDIECEVEV